QEALRATLLGTTRRAPTDRLERVYDQMVEDFNAHKFAEVVEMAEEGQAVAGEVRRARPDVAAQIYRMLGASFVERFEHVKGVGLLEQARALAVESGDRAVLEGVCDSLGHFHLLQGEYEKAIEEHEQARAIAVELGNRENEGFTCHNLGISYTSLKQYDKAIELFEQSLAVSEQLGNKSVQAATCLELGRCLSRHGQHDRAVACLKQAWLGYYEPLGNPDELPRAAVRRGEVLWEQARAEHLQAAPDATSFGGVSAAVAGRLKSAETWLLTGLELAGKVRIINLKMDAVIHLACVAMLKGDEDEAINHLAQFLHWWLELAPKTCSACGHERRESTPLMTCDGCRVARCVLCQALAVRQRLP
ncbi:MAG: tetratricopeptide repeat protein, partial [Promethearchaeia archaeon]